MGDGYAICVSACYGCERLFGYHPHKVPSIKGKPLCEDCMAQINEGLVAKGHEPIVIDPEAYEPVPMEEL